MNETSISLEKNNEAGSKPDRPLVVGYILKMFPRFSETFILNEILELEKIGVRVVVFSMRPPDEAYRQPAMERVQAPVLQIPPFEGASRREHLTSHVACLIQSPLRYAKTFDFVRRRGNEPAWNKFLVAPYIVRRARAFCVEHFHAHFASAPARQAKFVSMLSGIPFSFTAHARDLFWEGHQHGKNNKLKKRIRLANFVVTISEYNREFIMSRGFKVPRRRLVTIYNGLDLTRWPILRPNGRPVDPPASGKPMILAVGRLVPKKGFEVLIKACRKLRDREQSFHCVIAGEGPERDRLERRIRKHGLDGCVELVGPVPQDHLLERYYRQASVLVQPCVVGEDGDQDGIPTVILEAMAVGLPVVATPVSGIGEAVVNGETGLLVPPGDSATLAETMDEILKSPNLIARLAKMSRQLVEIRFNLKNNTKLLVHLMRVSARGDRRWSDNKLREKMGLSPLEDREEGDPADVPVEG